MRFRLYPVRSLGIQGILVLLVVFWVSLVQSQYRNYTLPCLAPILQSIDPNAPQNLQEAFLAGPIRFASPLEGIGAESISFPISTKSPEAQRLFEQGVALLHTLSFHEAERFFRMVIHLDPDCPMGYWGLAQANELKPGRARVFAKVAREKCDRNRPEFEQQWIELLADSYAEKPEANYKEQSLERIRELEELVMDFPENIEAKAFLVRRLALNQYRVGVPVTSQLGVDALARDLALVAPRHPSRHYRAFIWLQQRPQRGLKDTLEATSLSRRTAEVWSYAAEAHTAAGRSSEAANLSETAIRTAHRALSERRQMPSEAENLSANYAALIDTLTSAGRIGEAIEWAKRLISLPRANLASTSDGERLYAMALMQSGQWEKLLSALEQDTYLLASSGFEARALRLNWKGMCLLALGRFDEAQRMGGELEILEKEALVAGSSNFVEKSIASARQTFESVRKFLTSDAAGDALGGIDLPVLVKAAFYEQAGMKGKAFHITSEAVAKHTASWLLTATYCRLAYETGHTRDAFFRFDRSFRINAGRADSDLTLLKQLNPLAKELNLSPDAWKFSTPNHVSDNRDEAGPVSWIPMPAPEFVLSDRSGNIHSLSGFKGQPLVLTFFLGARCVFCLEQFEEFRPHLPAFEEAGIRMAAVSIDSVESMNQVFAEADMEQMLNLNLPYPVLADPKLEVFKAFGVFDDFENGPMHATILIGPKGSILWQTISHGTFKEPGKLLMEAKRLLSVHKQEPGK